MQVLDYCETTAECVFSWYLCDLVILVCTLTVAMQRSYNLFWPKGRGRGGIGARFTLRKCRLKMSIHQPCSCLSSDNYWKLLTVSITSSQQTFSVKISSVPNITFPQHLATAYPQLSHSFWFQDSANNDQTCKRFSFFSFFFVLPPPFSHHNFLWGFCWKC